MKTWARYLKSESLRFLIDKMVINQNIIANIKCHSTNTILSKLPYTQKAHHEC